MKRKRKDIKLKNITLSIEEELYDLLSVVNNRSVFISDILRYFLKDISKEELVLAMLNDDPVSYLISNKLDKQKSNTDNVNNNNKHHTINTNNKSPINIDFESFW